MSVGWAPESVESPATTGRVLGGLFLVGAASGALTLVLPHASAADTSVLWTNVVVAFAASLGLMIFAPRMRPWMFQLVVVAGTLTITRAVYYSHDAGSFYSFWYVWIGLFSFFFFGRKWGLIQLALVGIAFGWVLAELPASSSVVRWLMTVATVIIGGALVDVLAHRVRIREAAARSRARSLEIVSDAAHELARQGTSASVGASICKAALEASHGRSATVWHPSADGRGLVAMASTEPEAREEVIPFVQVGSPVIDAFVSGQRRGLGPGATADDSSLFEPMLRDGVPVGVLAIDRAGQPSQPSDELDQVIALLALEGALSLERAETLARLERVARTDDLTGLANRRSFDEQFGRELARAMRQESSLAVALLDLDHFKRYNDNFGHPAGDRLLKEIASNWEAAVRATDVLARYGGEEFALLLPGASPDEARSTLERLRTSMPPNQRVSAGLVFWDGGESSIDMLARADHALYEAKAGGRDTVVSA